MANRILTHARTHGRGGGRSNDKVEEVEVRLPDLSQLSGGRTTMCGPQTNEWQR